MNKLINVNHYYIAYHLHLVS